MESLKKAGREGHGRLAVPGQWGQLLRQADVGTEESKDLWEPVNSCAPLGHHVDQELNSPELL